METSELKLNQLFDTEMPDSRMSILIVDDQESILNSLSRTLTAVDDTYKIETAASAEEALEILAVTPFDLVISDLCLPEMNGLELTESVHKNNPDTSSILMTAYGDRQISKTAKEQGSLYLEKPFDINQLIERINFAFSRRGRFRVSLPDVTLTDIVKLYQHNNDSAVLSIVAENTAGMVVIETGRITHVRLDDIEGPDALLKILDLKSGSINALSCSAPQRETLSVSAERLEAAILSQHPLERLRLINGGYMPEECKENENSEIWLADGLADALTDNLEVAFKTEHEEALEDKELEENKEEEEEEKTSLAASGTNSKRPLRVPTGSITGVKLIDNYDEELKPLPEESIPIEELQRPILVLKKEKVKNLIQKGVELFKAKKLTEAKESWTKVLEIDPKCTEAKRNLSILEQVTNSLKKIS